MDDKTIEAQTIEAQTIEALGKLGAALETTERAARDELADGQRHGLEMRLKRERQRLSAAAYADNDSRSG